jgi:hypothetical protein
LAVETIQAAAEAAIEAITPEIEPTYSFVKYPGEGPLADSDPDPSEELRWFQVAFIPEPRFTSEWNGSLAHMSMEFEVVVRYRIPADMGGWATFNQLAADDSIMITHALGNPTGAIDRSIQIRPLRGNSRALGSGHYLLTIRYEVLFTFKAAGS